MPVKKNKKNSQKIDKHKRIKGKKESPKEAKSIEDIEEDIKKNLDLIEDTQKELVEDETENKKEESLSDSEHIFVKKELVEEGSKKPVEEIEEIFDKKELRISNITNSDERFSQEEISKKLTEIYEDDDGDMPDMQKFKKSNRSPFLRAFFILIFSFIFFAVIAWAGFFVLQPGDKFSEEDIILTMSGNEDFVSGEENTYRIRYKNSQNVPLHGVVLEVRYPKGFEFSTSTKMTKDDNHDSWDIGELEAGGSGYIDVVGKMFGSLNDEQSFRVFMNYVPGNFSSSFQKVTSLTLKNTQTLVTIEIEKPEQIVAGLDTPLKIILSPNSDVAVKNILVTCQSESFSFKSSDPKTEDGKDCEWFFESLENTQEINVSGFFSNTSQENNKFTVEVKALSSQENKNEFYTLNSLDTDITLSKLDTVFSLLVNGTAGSFEMQPGETISATLIMQNNGESVLGDAKLKLILDAPAYNNRSILDWTKLDMIDKEGDIVGQKMSDEIRRGTIAWDERHIEELKELKPGDEIKLNLTLPVKDSEDINLSDYLANYIKISGELTYMLNGKEEIIGSNEIEIKLLSDLTLSSTDDIDEDVEGNTVHHVSWLLSNSYHDLKDIEITADLYGDISLDEESFVVPAGTITYDSDTKKLLWKIDKMPISVDVLAVQFDIKILSENPSQKNLTSKPSVEAYDEVLQQGIKVYGKEILLGQ